MANRMMSYGYGLQDGKIIAIDREVKIVKRIFKEYICGARLDAIAMELTEEGIEYYMGNCSWNKNRIARVIENEKYIGSDDYPQIINDDDFICAKQLKESKGAKKIRFDETIEYLRGNKITCNQCGKPMKRISKWRNREKWTCRCGCKNNVFVSDSLIFQGVNEIIKTICSTPDSLRSNKKCSHNCMEIKKCTNEINRLIGSCKPSFKAGKKLIFHLAELTFEKENEVAPSIYSELLLEDGFRIMKLGKADRSFFENYCQKISIGIDGEVTVMFITGAELSSKGGSEYVAGTKNHN